MKYLKYIFFLAITVAVTVMCSNVTPEKPDDTDPSKEDTPDDPQEKEGTSITLTLFEDLNQGETPLNNHAGACGRSSIRKMESSYVEIPTSVLKISYPNYPRLRVLPDGTYFLTFQQALSSTDGNGASIIYMTSPDLVNWKHMGYLFKMKTIKNALGNDDSNNFTNGNALVLQNGELMVVGSYRTVHTYTKKDRICDHGIVAKFSKDNGKTWYDERQIYTGPNWEPHLLQMPDGEIHCYIVNPRPWISSANSGTLLITSNDNGRTWSPTFGEPLRHVMRSKYWSDAKNQYLFTDQMPVGVLLNGTDQFAFAVEAVRTYTSSAMVHATDIVFSGKNGWGYIPDDEETEAKCERVNGLDNNNDGIGPYLVQFHSGETVVTYTKGKNSMLFSRVGDETARIWAPEDATSPFPKYGGWSSCEMESDHTLLMVNKYSQDGNRGIALARFALNHDIAATPRTIKLDGDNSEWANTDEALYLSPCATTSSTLRCSKDNDFVSFLVEVADRTVAKGDKITLTLSPVAAGDVPAAGALKFTLSPNGITSVNRYGSSWAKYESKAQAAVAYEGTKDDSSDTDKGYIVELRIPRDELTLPNGEMSLNFELYDSNPNKKDKLTRVVHVTNL